MHRGRTGISFAGDGAKVDSVVRGVYWVDDQRRPIPLRHKLSICRIKKEPGVREISASGLNIKSGPSPRKPTLIQRLASDDWVILLKIVRADGKSPDYHPSGARICPGA